jgi:pimeloyl-ACP methyl ester carboxylesterase
MERRTFLQLLAGAVAGGLGAAAVVHEDSSLRDRLEEHLGLDGGPDLGLPSSHAKLVQGTFASRFMRGQVGYAYSLPDHGQPKAVVISLYGKGGDQLTAFNGLHLPDAAAYVGASLCIASANGGADNYWHRRSNGTDAHAMLVDEFAPLLSSRLGGIPFVLHGFSMGGYGALLTAERGATADVDNFFKGVAVASPALWTEPGDTAPGAFDSPADFYANDVFSAVDDLKSLPVRLDCGQDDPFYPAVLRLAALMTWPHQAVYRPGAGHTLGYWRFVAPAQMRYLAQCCGALS